MKSVVCVVSASSMEGSGKKKIDRETEREFIPPKLLVPHMLSFTYEQLYQWLLVHFHLVKKKKAFFFFG